MDGVQWKVGKADFIGKDEAERFAGGKPEDLATHGNTLVFVQKNGELVAVIALKDVVREETKLAINRLQKEGIYTGHAYR